MFIGLKRGLFPFVFASKSITLRKVIIPQSKFQQFKLQRFQSTANTESNAKPVNNASTADDLFENRLKSLESFVEREYINKNDNDSNDRIMDIYESIKNYQLSIYDFNKLSPSQNKYIQRSNELLRKVLADPKTKFDEILLKKLFITQPLFPTLQTIIKAYYSKGSSIYIPSPLALIPFRKLIWDSQFQQALDYVELTNGNKRYIEHRKNNLKKILKYFGGSIIGLITGIHGYVSIFFPEIITAGAGGTSFGIYGIYACIVTYIVNCGFLAGLAFSSKGLENGNLMFKQSTMPHDWYLKVDQMKMCSKILEADAEIHGIDGFATRDVVSRIQKMGFEVNEPEEEVMLRQYWYSSGEGFMWVEPDIDPVDVEWWKHLDDIGVKKVWDQDLNKIEQADASEEVEDNDHGAELYIPGDKKD
jgi:hypothetical protein